MPVSYKKLWKLLIDKNMKKKDLCEKAGISPASVTKIGRNGHVTTEIKSRITEATQLTQVIDKLSVVSEIVCKPKSKASLERLPMRRKRLPVSE